MPVRAKSPIASCPRCLKPAPVGTWIEPFWKSVGGARRWAHVGCSAPVRQQPSEDPFNDLEPVRKPEPTPADLTIDVVPDSQVPPVTVPATAGLLTKVRAELAAIAGEVLTKVLPDLVEDRVQSAAHEIAVSLANNLAEMEKNLTRAVNERIAKEIATLPPKEFVVRQGDTVRRLPKGEVYQPCFERLLRLAGARKNILLIGPTGSGKTHTAKQVAVALDLPFSVMSCSGGLTEAKFLGRINPLTLEYRVSDFIDRYENGGVCCLDELDGADPNVTLVLNSAIANDFIGLPDRTDNPIAKRHPNFVLIATANTWGHGSTRKFCGRYPIDEATLDRFRVGTIEVGYVTEIEKRLVNGNQEVFDRLTAWRKAIFDNGLERVVSTRFFKDVAEMMEKGDTWKDIESSFFGGWRKEEIQKVLGRSVV